MRRAGQLCNWCRLSVRAPASDSGRRTGTARQTTHLRLFFSLDVLSPVSLPGRSAVCVAPLVLRRIGAFLSLLALSPLSLWAVLQSAMPVLARAPLLQPESILSVHSSSLRPPLQSSRQLTAAFSHLLCKPEVSLNNTEPATPLAHASGTNCLSCHSFPLLPTSQWPVGVASRALTCQIPSAAVIIFVKALALAPRPPPTVHSTEPFFCSSFPPCRTDRASGERARLSSANSQPRR